MKKIHYDSLVGDGFKLLEKNLILLMPNVFITIISFSLFAFLFIVGGFKDLLMNKPYILLNYELFTNELSILFSTPRFAVVALVWFCLELLISAFFVVMKYGMIKDVVLNKKTSLKSGIVFAEKNYFKYWAAHIVNYSLIYGPFILISGFYVLINKTSINSSLFNIGNILITIFVIIWAIYAFFMLIRIFYIYPVLTFENKNVFESFDDDFHYVKTHMTHTYISFLVFLIFVIGWMIAKDLLNVFTMSMKSYTIMLIIVGITILLEILITTWEHIFVFESYVVGKKQISKTSKKSLNSLNKSKNIKKKIVKKSKVSVNKNSIKSKKIKSRNKLNQKI
jgi:hypothetical protein